ncbi:MULTISPECIES: hypothetical protein [Bradyrhizobium]|uniref:hypothetical protein n=1 Tax=Bradyrhizobium TaxID=374 RepID=UPI0019115210|nr:MULTISPECIES: hypothetical protein [Bradyrhizobium]WOH56935.1 hypothetical protein RX329_32525 [Bradyrhizobium sp. BWC-3-1]
MPVGITSAELCRHMHEGLRPPDNSRTWLSKGNGKRHIYCSHLRIDARGAETERRWPKDLIPVKVKITVAGDHMVFDYTGTAKQVPAASIARCRSHATAPGSR